VEEVKTEKTYDLPSLVYQDEVIDQLLAEFRAFVGDVTSEKFILLSKTEHIVFENEQVSRQLLPPDVNLIYIRIEGNSGFVEVKNRSVYKNIGEIADKSLNLVTIQGSNPVAVRGLQVKVAQTLRPETLLIRTVFYRFPVSWFWATLVLLWFGEYRLLRYLRPTVSIDSPLSAFAAIVIFAGALGTALLYGNCAVRLFTYCFPYFEIKENISRHRLRTQKVVASIWLSLITSGVLNLLSLLGSSIRK
jgi:hypothetical protein